MKKENGLNFIFSVLIIVGITFLLRSSNNMVGTTLPLLGKYVFHFSQFEIGILVAVLSLASFLSTVLINARLNAKERRIAFIFSALLYAITFIGFWYSDSITIWFFSAISGATLGLIMPNIITSASLFEDQRVRERVISIYTITLSISLVAGPAIESYLLKFLSLKYVFLIFSALGIGVLIFSFFIKFPEEKRIKEKISVMRNDGFRIALLNILTNNIPFSIIVSFLGIYERDYFKISLAEVSILFSLFFLAAFFSRLYLFLKPPKRLALNISVSVIITLIGLILLTLSNNLLLFSLSLIVMGIPHGLAYPLSVITIGRSFPPNHRNIANSYYFSIMKLIGILVPATGGLLIDYVGFKYVFLLLIAVIIAILIPLSRELKILSNNKGYN